MPTRNQLEEQLADVVRQVLQDHAKTAEASVLRDAADQVASDYWSHLTGDERHTAIDEKCHWYVRRCALFLFPLMLIGSLFIDLPGPVWGFGWGVICVSVLLGDLVISKLEEWFRTMFPTLNNTEHIVPPWLSGCATGMVERLFFSLAVACNLGGCVVAMIAWTTVKNTGLWANLFRARPEDLNESERDLLRTYVALCMGFLSMLFALVGGMIFHASMEKIVNS